MRFNHDGAMPPIFYEDDIIALQELEANELYVPLRRLCDNLGLSLEQAERSMLSHAVLANGLQAIPGSGGPNLRVDLIPLWFCLLDLNTVKRDLRSRLELHQRECASVLWQAFKPQGFSAEDALVPPRFDMTPADQAYMGAMAQASLARQQMLVERQLQVNQADGNRSAPRDAATLASSAFELARAVRRVAHTMAERSRRNEYSGVFSGLYRQFGISSYRNMPRGRLYEALEWLERWHGDLLGEPEPPPDI